MTLCPSCGTGEQAHINNIISPHLFCISGECLKPWFTEWNIVKYISRGYFGVTFQVCNKKISSNPCNYVIKIQIRLKDTTANLDQELEVAKLMGEIGVGPKVLDIFSCPGYFKNTKNKWVPDILYCIVMEKMDITYLSWKKLLDKTNTTSEDINNLSESFINIIKLNSKEKLSQREYVSNKITEQYFKMKKAGYLHRDLDNETNIMLNIGKNGLVLDVKLIDFGVVYKYKQRHQVISKESEDDDDEEDDDDVYDYEEKTEPYK